MLLAGALAVAGLLLPAVGAAEWTTNSLSLDTGACGRNLQIGSNRTASATALPTFLLEGDGGGSSYGVSLDGKPLGTFGSTPDAVVCIRVGRRLTDGPHLLVGTELVPRAGTVVQLSFSVDTVPPRPPSRPVLSAHSDSGVEGDGVTAYRTVNLHGTAAPNQPVQIHAGTGAGVAGSVSDARGRWSATTLPLARGTHALTAVTFDSAGNRSAASAPLRLTIR